MTLTGSTISENNGNEAVLKTPQICRTEAWSSDTVYCHTQDPLPGEVLPLCGVYNQRILSPIDKEICFGQIHLFGIMFKMILKNINTLALKTLQQNMKYQPV